MQVPFNKPYVAGDEYGYIQKAVASGKISGNGDFTKECHRFFEKNYGFKKALLASSCTDALEMAAILSQVGPGDEVILPSFTFVSTANAFALRGAKLVFVDSCPDQPNLDPKKVKEAITPATRVICVVHYAGVACDMDPILVLAKDHNLLVVEDAAQAIESTYKDRPLGSIGALAAFSFHETKNIISGEGGLLAVNDEKFADRAEIIWEKGTNRSAFFRGETDKYGWVDIGSSFLPSELTAAFLAAQLEHIDRIQSRRLALWQRYYDQLNPFVSHGWFQLPVIPAYATNNAHMFYLLLPDLAVRTELISYLKAGGVNAVFHYLSLHKSAYFQGQHDGRELSNSDRFTDSLLRLPMFFELTDDQVDYVCDTIRSYFRK
jgi:dTDP-4-amino-4,6-dideoxygalactose transaminase